MIFVTGDTHGNLDIAKLRNNNFKIHKELSKKDYLIICGDFGCIWDNSATDLYWRKWHNNKNYTTLFIDGNHENFNILNTFPTITWNGGKVHQIEENVFHLMRGQVFNIEGKRFFTMGGGTSVDREMRKEGVSWWPQENISSEELEEALNNLKKYNWEIDYVITHTISNLIMKKRLCYQKECSELNNFLDILQTRLKYKWWFFGHFHTDIVMKEEKCTCLYNKIRGLDNKIY